MTIGGEAIRVTPNHPFWVEGRGWTPAEELSAQSQLDDEDGHGLQLSNAVSLSHSTTVFNIEVEDFHTYFVGHSHAWVHNACALPPQYALGAHLGAGAYKDAYAAAGDPNAVVRVLKNNANANVLASEHTQLQTLAQRGVPVVRVLAEGEVNGKIADVVERYEISNRDPQWAQQGPRLVASARDDLMRIRQGILQGGVAIQDIQLLFKQGHVVVSDPLGIILREQNAAAYNQLANGNAQFIDNLLRLAPQPGVPPPPPPPPWCSPDPWFHSGWWCSPDPWCDRARAASSLAW